MTAIVNKSYIKNISETPVSNLPPVNGPRFMKALEKTYGESNVQQAMRWLNSGKFEGSEAFQERIISAMSGGAFQGEDQKYIADAVFRVFSKQINPVKI